MIKFEPCRVFYSFFATGLIKSIIQEHEFYSTLKVLWKKVSNGAKIRNRYNQVPHLTQDTNGKVTNSQKTPQTRAFWNRLLAYKAKCFALEDLTRVIITIKLWNELGERDKMRGLSNRCLSNILSLYRNEFNKFNDTRARILNFIYHMT